MNTVDGNRFQQNWRRVALMLTVACGLTGALLWALPLPPVVAQSSEINFAFDAYTVNEDAGTLVVTATVNPTTTEAVTVTFVTDTNNANASANEDYVGVRRSIGIPPGATLITAEVPIIDDNFVEGDERFGIGIVNIPEDIVPGRVTATVTIRNDDVARLRVEDTTVWENAGSAVVTVTQSLTSTLQTYFNIYTIDGSARAGEDYSAVPSFTVLDIPPGARSATLNVPLFDDDLAESNRYFTVAITDALNATIERPTATVTLIDEDALPTLSIADASASERDATLRFTVTADGATHMDIQVDYATADGSATAPDDYSATSGQLLIPSGTLTATISVPLNDDSLVEGDEQFTLTLANPLSATLAVDQATGQIVDDDQASQVDNRVFLPSLRRE